MISDRPMTRRLGPGARHGLKRLSDLGDQLETFRSAVDFELFRPELLDAALSCTDQTEGGRPPFDPVLMFKILVIQATNTNPHIE